MLQMIVHGTGGSEDFTYSGEQHVYDPAKKQLTVMCLDKAPTNNWTDVGLAALRKDFIPMPKAADALWGAGGGTGVIYQQFLWRDPDRWLKWCIWRDEYYAGRLNREPNSRLMEDVFGPLDQAERGLGEVGQADAQFVPFRRLGMGTGRQCAVRLWFPLGRQVLVPDRSELRAAGETGVRSAAHGLPRRAAAADRGTGEARRGGAFRGLRLRLLPRPWLLGRIRAGRRRPLAVPGGARRGTNPGDRRQGLGNRAERGSALARTQRRGQGRRTPLRRYDSDQEAETGSDGAGRQAGGDQAGHRRSADHGGPARAFDEPAYGNHRQGRISH